MTTTSARDWPHGTVVLATDPVSAPHPDFLLRTFGLVAAAPAVLAAAEQPEAPPPIFPIRGVPAFHPEDILAVGVDAVVHVVVWGGVEDEEVEEVF